MTLVWVVLAFVVGFVLGSVTCCLLARQLFKSIDE